MYCKKIMAILSFFILLFSLKVGSSQDLQFLVDMNGSFYHKNFQGGDNYVEQCDGLFIKALWYKKKDILIGAEVSYNTYSMNEGDVLKDSEIPMDIFEKTAAHLYYLEIGPNFRIEHKINEKLFYEYGGSLGFSWVDRSPCQVVFEPKHPSSLGNSSARVTIWPDSRDSYGYYANTWVHMVYYFIEAKKIKEVIIDPKVGFFVGLGSFYRDGITNSTYECFPINANTPLVLQLKERQTSFVLSVNLGISIVW